MGNNVNVAVTKEAVAQSGERIYEEHLKAVLEPSHLGQVVAIHLPSRDYFLGDSLLEANDRLRKKHPDAGRGQVYTRGIGQRAVIRARTPRVTGSMR